MHKSNQPKRYAVTALLRPGRKLSNGALVKPAVADFEVRAVNLEAAERIALSRYAGALSLTVIEQP